VWRLAVRDISAQYRRGHSHSAWPPDLETQGEKERGFDLIHAPVVQKLS
jgi:hypothetical protein